MIHYFSADQYPLTQGQGIRVSGLKCSVYIYHILLGKNSMNYAHKYKVGLNS